MKLKKRIKKICFKLIYTLTGIHLKVNRTNEKRINRKYRLFAKDSKCHWCRKEMVLYTLKKGEKMPLNFATRDHIYHKFDPRRKLPNRHDSPPRTVLACHKCNKRRGIRDFKDFNHENNNN